MIFGAPVGSEESGLCLKDMGWKCRLMRCKCSIPAARSGVSREFASQAGSAETVTRIERSIASVGEIIRSGGADLNTPVIDNIYSTAENVRISDPAAYETRSAAEFYGERVHRSDYRQTEQNWEISRSFDDFAGSGYVDPDGDMSDVSGSAQGGQNTSEERSHHSDDKKRNAGNRSSSGRSFGNRLKDEFNIRYNS